MIAVCREGESLQRDSTPTLKDHPILWIVGQVGALARFIRDCVTSTHQRPSVPRTEPALFVDDPNVPVFL